MSMHGEAVIVSKYSLGAPSDVRNLHMYALLLCQQGNSHSLGQLHSAQQQACPHISLALLNIGSSDPADSCVS